MKCFDDLPVRSLFICQFCDICLFCHAEILWSSLIPVICLGGRAENSLILFYSSYFVHLVLRGFFGSSIFVICSSSYEEEFLAHKFLLCLFVWSFETSKLREVDEA